MNQVEKYFIPGIPVAWKRPGQTRFKIRYDEQKKEKQTVQWEIISQLQEKKIPLLAPVKVIFQFLLPIPESFNIKRKQDLLYSLCHFRPDLSNYIKFYEDALNDILWKDDALIVSLIAQKLYSKEPGTEITVERLVSDQDIPEVYEEF